MPPKTKKVKITDDDSDDDVNNNKTQTEKKTKIVPTPKEGANDKTNGFDYIHEDDTYTVQYGTIAGSDTSDNKHPEQSQPTKEDTNKEENKEHKKQDKKEHKQEKVKKRNKKDDDSNDDGGNNKTKDDDDDDDDDDGENACSTKPNTRNKKQKKIDQEDEEEKEDDDDDDSNKKKKNNKKSQRKQKCDTQKKKDKRKDEEKESSEEEETSSSSSSSSSDEEEEDDEETKKDAYASLLKPTGLLNDIVINDFIKYAIQSRSARTGLIAVSTRVWKIISKCNNKKSREYRKTFSDTKIMCPDMLFHKDYLGTVVVPLMLRGNHWVVAEIDYLAKRCILWNSRKSDYPKANDNPEVNSIVTRLLEWTQQIWNKYAPPQGHELFCSSDWSYHIREDAPQQTPQKKIENCGIYMLVNIKTIFTYCNHKDPSHPSTAQYSLDRSQKTPSQSLFDCFSGSSVSKIRKDLHAYLLKLSQASHEQLKTQALSLASLLFTDSD